MSYAHDLLDAVKQEMDWENPTEEELPLIAMYTLLAAVRGQETTAEDVHEAWSIWTAAFRNRPEHPSLIPFEELTEEIQHLDDPYVEAIRRAS